MVSGPGPARLMDIVEEELQARGIAAGFWLGFLRDCVCLCGKIFRRRIDGYIFVCILVSVLVSIRVWLSSVGGRLSVKRRAAMFGVTTYLASSVGW